MNNLKFNLLVITIILMISVFFTSCTKDEVITQTNRVETNNPLVNTLSSRSTPSVNWGDLTAQQQADFARFLGRLWGDGLPSNLNNLTGSNFTSKPTKHNQIYDRLKGVFELPNSSTRKNMPDFYDYWIDAIPGGNPSDPQILREAVKNPNFIAGLIDTEGQIQHNGNFRYLIEDQTFLPSHPDVSKGWGLRNFKPNRIIQLFCLLEETYGFDNTKIRVGNKEFSYAQKDEAINETNERYQNTKEMNEDPDTGTAGFTVKIFIDPSHFEEIRSYGYWEKQECKNNCESNNGLCIDACKFRSPAPDDASLNILTGDFPAIFVDDANYFKIIHKESGDVMNSGIVLSPIFQDSFSLWSMIDVDGEYFRIVSKEKGKWLKANTNLVLSLASNENTGWQTQWKKQQLATGNFYLINRKFKDKYLRADIGKTKVKIGAKGKQAEWKFN